MNYVTTCHAEGFSQYGHRLLEGWNLFPKDDMLYWYTEGYDLPITRNVVPIDNSTIGNLVEFKSRHSSYCPPNYLWDVVRFSHKIYAVHDAMRDASGKWAWIDADIVPMKEVPSGFVESLLNDGDYIAMFRRKGMYSECGFWIVDCDHPAHKRFFDMLIDLYDSDTFKKLREWHDSYLMDVVVRQLEREGSITVTNLTTQMDAEHPMAVHPVFSVYFDHLKGPERKKLGHSPERKVA